MKKSPQAIEKEMKRQRRARPDLERATPNELPSGVSVKEPSFMLMTHITIELPFHHLERHLEHDLPIMDFHLQAVRSITMNERDAVHSGLWAPNNEVEKALQLVIPDFAGPNESFDFSLMGPEMRLFASPLHRAIIFSIANNFAGFGTIPKEQVIIFLQRGTSEGLYRMIRSAPQYYTTQAVALNLFRAAIDVGDARIVDFLLQEPLPYIDVNDLICSHNGSKYTPIEKAAALLHTNVVRTLLNHEANANLSCPKRDCPGGRGALECAVKGIESSSKYARVAEIDPELFVLLVQAGAQLDPSSLAYLA
jgi:hypothetical protein